MCFISEESRFGEKYYRSGCKDKNVSLNLNICIKQFLLTERFSNVMQVDAIKDKYTSAMHGFITYIGDGRK